MTVYILFITEGMRLRIDEIDQAVAMAGVDVRVKMSNIGIVSVECGQEMLSTLGNLQLGGDYCFSHIAESESNITIFSRESDRDPGRQVG